jgi:hypothetical protein
MPAVSLLQELISGIEPIFVMRFERRQSKHPISSIYRLNQGADRLQEECRKRPHTTCMKPPGADTNPLIASRQV